MVKLEDDRFFFSPYYAVPIVRRDIARQYLKIAPVLNELGKGLYWWFYV
ncbi:MAG: hypothetical protein PHN35_00705 [Clostridia bacterium]|nr:hypothetical protein [Clostridia bacterium]